MLNTLSFILRHPLNKGNRVRALARFARWQISTRLLGQPVVVPFVGRTRLLVSRGMTGATGNVYCGLHEVQDMGAVLHALRPQDLFVDVGANIGSYTILAAGAVGARCIAFEPIPSTFEHLIDNVFLNRLNDRVVCHNAAAGRSAGRIRFTADRDTMNRALGPDEYHAGATAEVPVGTLDTYLLNQNPVFIKIDTEGFETAVVDGATETLAKPSVMAVLMELTGNGAKFGEDEKRIYELMLELGFRCHRYDPLNRQTHPADRITDANSLFVRDLSWFIDRTREAPEFDVQSRRL